MFNIFSRRKHLEKSVQANAASLKELQKNLRANDASLAELQKSVQANAVAFEELQKGIANIKDIVNALAKSKSEEAAPYSQVLDEWLNGKEEPNG